MSRIADQTIVAPTFSIAVALLARARGGSNAVIYYDQLARTHRALCRLTGISQETAAHWIAQMAGVRVRPVPHGDATEDYPHLHLRSMEMATDAVVAMRGGLKCPSWQAWLRNAIGDEEGLAYLSKQLAWRDVFPILLAAHTVFASTGGTHADLALSATFDDDRRRALQKWLPAGCTVVRWPRYYRWLASATASVAIVSRFWIALLLSIANQGIAPQRRRESAGLAAEFIDPRRLGGGPHDADYLAGHDGSGGDDFLLFVTPRQERRLSDLGISRADLKARLRETPHKWAFVSELHYSWRSIATLFRLSVTATFAACATRDYAVSRACLECWFDYLELLPLFTRYDLGAVLYLTFPNGRTGLRFDDPVVTGLARQRGTLSIGCQTRTLYARKYEDAFNCCDLYFSWGRAWVEFFPESTEFVKHIVTIGCVALDALIDPARESTAPPPADTARPIVMVFPGDVSPMHHYTRGYFKSFVLACAALAEQFPRYDFRIRLKFAEHVALLRDDPEMSAVLASLAGRFGISEGVKHEYSDALKSAAAVIALGYTTPGVEGMLIGKPAVYYSTLHAGGQAFEAIPNLVATNTEQLCSHFEHEMREPRQAAALDGLDPFRDGCARTRALREIQVHSDEAKRRSKRMAA